MRQARTPGFALAAIVALVGLGVGMAARPLAPGWRIGFWAWDPSWEAGHAVPEPPLPVDDVYLQARFTASGTRSGPTAGWPARIPPASRYWTTWRFEQHEPLSGMVDPGQLGRQATSLQSEARGRRLAMAGIQIDFDCPTGQLSAYATWLARLRSSLPPGMQLSITALLDWFRPGTRVADVLGQVSEFVPQFYDAAPDAGGGLVVAQRVDAARWAQVFNRFKVPYRVGISSFGRVALAGRARAPFLLGPSLIELFAAPGLDRLPAATISTGERRLVLRATRRTSIEGMRLSQGETIEIVLPTRDSVASAYAEARKMGGNCAGVIFFRWPMAAESTVLAPEEVFRAISGHGEAAREAGVEAIAGDCATVRCFDLYLLPGDQFPAGARRFDIRASGALEYFVPRPEVARLASMTGRETITVRLPPYHGETRLHLGRAMSKGRSRFTIERGQR